MDYYKQLKDDIFVDGHSTFVRSIQDQQNQSLVADNYMHEMEVNRTHNINYARQIIFRDPIANQPNQDGRSYLELYNDQRISSKILPINHGFDNDLNINVSHRLRYKTNPENAGGQTNISKFKSFKKVEQYFDRDYYIIRTQNTTNEFLGPFDLTKPLPRSASIDSLLRTNKFYNRDHRLMLCKNNNLSLEQLNKLFFENNEPKPNYSGISFFDSFDLSSPYFFTTPDEITSFLKRDYVLTDIQKIAIINNPHYVFELHDYLLRDYVDFHQLIKNIGTDFEKVANFENNDEIRQIKKFYNRLDFEEYKIQKEIVRKNKLQKINENLNFEKNYNSRNFNENDVEFLNNKERSKYIEKNNIRNFKIDNLLLDNDRSKKANSSSLTISNKNIEIVDFQKQKIRLDNYFIHIVDDATTNQELSPGISLIVSNNRAYSDLYKIGFSMENRTILGDGINISNFLNDTSLPRDIEFILRTSIISEVQFLKIKKLQAFDLFESRLHFVPITKYINGGNGFDRNIFNINDTNNYQINIDSYKGEVSKNINYEEFGFLNFKDSDGVQSNYQYATTEIVNLHLTQDVYEPISYIYVTNDSDIFNFKSKKFKIAVRYLGYYIDEEKNVNNHIFIDKNGFIYEEKTPLSATSSENYKNNLFDKTISLEDAHIAKLKGIINDKNIFKKINYWNNLKNISLYLEDPDKIVVNKKYIVNGVDVSKPLKNNFELIKISEQKTWDKETFNVMYEANEHFNKNIDQNLYNRLLNNVRFSSEDRINFAALCSGPEFEAKTIDNAFTINYKDHEVSPKSDSKINSIFRRKTYIV